MNDPINHPLHYIRGGTECIDCIKNILGNSYKGYLLGNAIKYIWRHDAKGRPIEDLKKAEWYLNRYREDIKFDILDWWKRRSDSSGLAYEFVPRKNTIEFLRRKALRFIERRQIDNAIMIVLDMIQYYELTQKEASL